MVKKFLLAFCISATFTGLASREVWAQKGGTPTWVDATGKYTTQAEFVKLDGDSVVLKKTDGTTTTIPMSKLNAQSQKQARDLAASAKAIPAPKPSPLVPVHLQQQRRRVLPKSRVQFPLSSSFLPMQPLSSLWMWSLVR